LLQENSLVCLIIIIQPLLAGGACPGSTLQRAEFRTRHFRNSHAACKSCDRYEVLLLIYYVYRTQSTKYKKYTAVVDILSPRTPYATIGVIDSTRSNASFRWQL